MVIVGAALSHLLKEIHIRAKLLYIVSFIPGQIDTDFLFEYRIANDNRTLRLGFRELLLNGGVYELNLNIVYFKGNPDVGWSSRVFVFFEIEDDKISDFYNQLGDTREILYAMNKDSMFFKFLRIISEKILGALSLLDILTVNIPAGQSVTISLPSGTRAISIFEEGLASFTSVGNVWFYDGTDSIPIIPGTTYPIGANFQVVNRDTASLRRIFVMCLG